MASLLSVVAFLVVPTTMPRGHFVVGIFLRRARVHFALLRLFSNDGIHVRVFVHHATLSRGSGELALPRGFRAPYWSSLSNYLFNDNCFLDTFYITSPEYLTADFPLVSTLSRLAVYVLAALALAGTVTHAVPLDITGGVVEYTVVSNPTLFQFNQTCPSNLPPIVPLGWSYLATHVNTHCWLQMERI
jgi:hypothetical protein